MEDLPPLGTNLRRLLLFHHVSNKEAAAALGVSENSVLAWMTGNRKRTTDVVLRIAETYHINPAALMKGPLDFAEVLGNRDRVVAAERTLRGIKKGTKVAPLGLGTRLRARRKPAWLSRIFPRMSPLRQSLRQSLKAHRLFFLR